MTDEQPEIMPPDIPQVVVRRVQKPTPCRHPLATRSGAELLGMMIAADQHWRPLTARQKTALRTAYQDALAAIPDGTPDGTVVPLPLLPHGTHPATARSLNRRGLAADGRLTTLAIEVLRYVPPEARQTVTTHSTGDVL